MKYENLPIYKDSLDCCVYVETIEKLRDRCEDTKMLIHLAKELKAFKSFKQFEHSVKLIVPICKQSQSWLNYFARVSK